MPPLWIAGIDEAGRGCLAGPVIAAAVILPEQYTLPHLGDSKTLSAVQRDRLAPAIRDCAVAWSLGAAWPREIERVNILQATFWAMARAVRGLRVRPHLLHIDGNHTIPHTILTACRAQALPRQQAFVRGDATHAAIAAASVLAKTFRDRIMGALHRRWRVYGFDQHKGYGTAAHKAAILSHGACPQHRMTFAGVREVSVALLPLFNK